ncbi:MAG: 3-phosphoshikimate 1-carboxyvinyltransferase [Paramuribaculum sp.]|nr:3-phosphoshikimate 1-carboxyvinyltransferase [Paramuribaculum sp.]
MNYRIFPPDELIETRISLPLSKSISNRALIINALIPGSRPLEEVAKCDDTDVMVKALSEPEAEGVDIGAAGTAMRFLTAYYAATEHDEKTIDGSERMRERPIGVLVDALRQLGADIEYAGKEGFPPLRIKGRRLAGGELTIASDVSSQYISALLMVAPVMERGLKLILTGETISRPYINMTVSMMERAGAQVETDGNTITVEPGGYHTNTQEPIEADWSAASYWFEIEALSSGFITLDNLSEQSLQGDSKLARYFAQLGVTTEFDAENNCAELMANPDQAPRVVLDMTDTPDVAQTVAVTCAMLGIPFELSGLASLHIKETDRIAALAKELLKVGVMLDTQRNDAISWDGRRRPVAEMPEFDTYADHRMAMAFAPVALYIPGICIRDAEVVSKSYPDFWKDLAHAGFIIADADAENAE